MNINLTQQNRHLDKNKWRYHRQTNGLQLSPHWHTHYEILLIYKGDGRVFSGGKVLPFRAPCVILYRPFTMHGMSVSAQSVYERSMINFTVGDVALFSEKLLSLSFLGDLPLLIIPLSEKQTEELDALFGAIFSNLWDFTENRLYIALIIHYLHCAADTQKLLASSTVQRAYISNVLQYLSENLSEPLRLESSAAYFGVGRTKLNEDLRKVTGMTFKEYLTELRMTKAKELLEVKESVADIAMECGYNSESNFIAAYRRRWGCTPGENRRK